MAEASFLITPSQVVPQGKFPNTFRSHVEVDSLSSRPNPFPCYFHLRDEKARDLILADTMAR